MREWNDYTGHLSSWERAATPRLLAFGNAGPRTRYSRPQAGDEAAWRLWAGYVAFYKSEVSGAVTAATWQRLFMPDSGMVGRMAEWEGAVSGFTISIVHPRSWALAPRCYLEDLFVDPAREAADWGGR